MSPENNFLAKLNRTYSGNGSSGVTPAQIERYIGVGEKLQEISELTGICDISLLKEVFHPNGRLLAHKITICVGSIEDLRGEYGDDTEEMLMHLDPKCFRKNGKINPRRLRKNIKKANGHLKEI
jgi:hypothetical protein